MPSSRHDLHLHEQLLLLVLQGDSEIDPSLGVVISLAHATGSLRIH